VLPLAISRGFLLPTYPWRVWRLMREHDVVSVHTPMLETGIVRLLSMLTRRPLVVTHHGDLVLPRGLGNRLVTAVMLAGYRFMARGVSTFVHHTRDYAERSVWLGRYLDRLEVVPPFVELPPPDPTRVAELRRRWGGDGGPLIGFAGRFVEEKRPDLLLRAMDVVAAARPGARLVFAGQHDVPYEGYSQRHRALVERLRDRLVLLGVLADPREMAAFYAACDVLALTSDTECFALVQVEAMLAGTPVVMTDVPGGRMPVRTTGMGRLAPRGDWQAIGEAILDVVGGRQRYQRPHAEIAALYDTGASLAAYEAIFRRAAGLASSAAGAPRTDERELTPASAPAARG
jgi:glycosyltransferase involved in cell wall biosynthesis